MSDLPIYNPHLPGEAFFWPADMPGGSTGVLLVHGFTATTAEVRPLGEFLRRHGFSVSAPLLPGHYTRPEDLNRVRWQDWVAAVEAAYQRLKAICERVVVAGESTGALLALFLAAEHPEVVAVLAYAPALRLQLGRFDRLRLHLMAPFLPYVPKPNMDGNPLWQGYPVNPLKGTLQLLHLQGQVWKRLKRIHQPLLVIQGRLDATVHPSVPAIIAAAVSSTIKEVIWMENSGHVVIIDHERIQVAELSLDFLQRVLAP